MFQYQKHIGISELTKMSLIQVYEHSFYLACEQLNMLFNLKKLNLFRARYKYVEGDIVTHCMVGLLMSLDEIDHLEKNKMLAYPIFHCNGVVDKCFKSNSSESYRTIDGVSIYQVLRVIQCESDLICSILSESRSHENTHQMYDYLIDTLCDSICTELNHSWSYNPDVVYDTKRLIEIRDYFLNMVTN